MAAAAKKKPDNPIYETNSFWGIEFSFSCSICCKNIIHDMIASAVSAITPRSVLLSTKTKKAHIPLLNHNSRKNHHE